MCGHDAANCSSEKPWLSLLKVEAQKELSLSGSPHPMEAVLCSGVFLCSLFPSMNWRILRFSVQMSSEWVKIKLCPTLVPMKYKDIVFNVFLRCFELLLIN